MRALQNYRRKALRMSRVLGDARAIRTGRIGQRIGRRVFGRVTGRAMRRMFR